MDDSPDLGCLFLRGIEAQLSRTELRRKWLIHWNVVQKRRKAEQG